MAYTKPVVNRLAAITSCAPTSVATSIAARESANAGSKS